MLNFDELKKFLPNYLQDEYSMDLRKNGVCPICGQGHKTGCFGYNPKNNTAHCFSCGWTGDIINLVADTKNVDLKEAAQMIADRYKGESPRSLEGFEAPAEATAEDFTAFIASAAANKEQTIFFFKSRGLSADLVGRAGLGYNPDTKEAIIPYFDAFGNPVWYTARRDYDTPIKYRCPKGAARPIPYNVGELLKESEKPCFVCEGEINTLSTIESGFDACGIGSISNYRLFISFIKSHEVKRPLIIMLDNDEPGQKAQAAILEALTEAKTEVYSALFPFPGKDVNDILKEDREGLKAALASIQASAAKATEEQKPLVKENGSAILDSFLLQVKNPDFKPIPTGFSRLDRVLGGGLYSGLCIVAAAPSEGKSAFTMQLCETIAEQEKRDILVFSFEMSAQQLVSRSLSRLSLEESPNKTPAAAVTALQVLRGAEWDNLEGAKQSSLKKAIARYREAIAPRLFIYDSLEPTTEAILTKIKEYEKAQPAGTQSPIILIDYLQLLDAGDDFASGCKKITLALKQYAIEHNTVVFAVSSINREGQRMGGSMFSLYGSSYAEYGCDVLLMLDFKAIKYRLETDKDKLKQQPIREMVITVEKNRMGETGKTIDFYYTAAYNSFTDQPTPQQLAAEVDKMSASSRKKSRDL